MQDSWKQSIEEFESSCSEVNHQSCVCCHTTSLLQELDSGGTCVRCQKLQDPQYYIRKKCLPIWYKNGIPMYILPNQLRGLSYAEQMLIQRASPSVPLHHIKNGTFGLSGHVCAFEQNIEKFFATLPRSRDDVDFICVVQTVRSEIGRSSKAIAKKLFRVRKKRCTKLLSF